MNPKTYTFHSAFQLGQRIHPATSKSFTQEVVKHEKMLFSADTEFAYYNAGPLTRTFINLLGSDWDDAIIDSRVHMLMPGFTPCIPGWHHDDIPRNRVDGQPNYDNPPYHAQHAMMLVNGDIAPTHFTTGTITLPDIEPGEVYYRKWHPLVEDACNRGALQLHTAPSNQIIYFDHDTFHKGVEANQNGWRFFIRATRNTHREFKNEIRKQVQVYLSNPMQGW